MGVRGERKKALFFLPWTLSSLADGGAREANEERAKGVKRHVSDSRATKRLGGREKGEGGERKEGTASEILA